MADANNNTESTPASSLYVGDLHPEITDGQLFDAFNEFKSLTSVRVCRDSTSGKSLCYGYVNFISPQDAMEAIEAKNHLILNGKAIRVTWSLRDPDGRRNGDGNVYVKNLSESINGAKLQEIFAKFGDISSCKVATSQDGKSMGYGYVQFTSDDSANAAIENMNGASVEGKQIYVSKFVRKTERDLLSNPDEKYTNLYFKNLDPEITEENLKKKFSEYGNIESLVIYKDDNGDSKGFGFVNFENPENAKRAVQAMHDSQLGSKNLYVAKAQKKVEREQYLRNQFEQKRKERLMKNMGSNVYIKNISDEVSDEGLRELFSNCGTITSVKLMRDDKGISKGFGFVCFSRSDEALNAVKSFNRFMVCGKPLYVAIAQRKEDRQAQLQLQYAQCLPRLPSPSSTMIPPGGLFSHFYYTPPTVVPQMPPQQGLMYQQLGMRPTWRPNGFAPVGPHGPPVFRPPMLGNPLPSSPWPKRQNRSRANDHAIPENKVPSQSATLPKELTSKQVKNVGKNGKAEVCKTAANCSGGSATTTTSENLSSKLSAASPQQQKQILGDHLFPLVHNHKPELAAKITGMLLEMDNAELLLLLESTDSLVTKVEEAMQVLKLTKAKISNNQEKLQANIASNDAEVSVS